MLSIPQGQRKLEEGMGNDQPRIQTPSASSDLALSHVKLEKKDQKSSPNVLVGGY